MASDSWQVFINYAKPDQLRALDIYGALKAQGINVWMDVHNLMPGQNWDFELKRALDKSSIVVAVVSKKSVDKRGYVQRELNIALDKMQEKLIDDISLIPILLDDELEIPNQLRSIQCISASEPNFIGKVVRSINFQIEKLGGEKNEVQRKEDLYWTTSIKKESWDGIPGYEFEIQNFVFSSERYQNVNEIGEYIKGYFLKEAFSYRSNKIHPMPELYNYAQDKWSRTHTTMRILLNQL